MLTPGPNRGSMMCKLPMGGIRHGQWGLREGRRTHPFVTPSTVVTPSPCADDELSNESCRQRPACAIEYGRKIGRPIRCQGLQALEQRRDCREGSADHERPGPGETEEQRDSEIADEVIELPAEMRAGCPFGRPEGSDYQQDYDRYAASFCASTKMFYSGARGNSPERGVTVPGPLQRCAGAQGHGTPPTHYCAGA